MNARAAAHEPRPLALGWRQGARRIAGWTAFLAIASLVALSAILIKGSHKGVPLIRLSPMQTAAAATIQPPLPATPPAVVPSDLLDPAPMDETVESAALDAGLVIEDAPEFPLDTRWFNGRPLRPVKVMRMLVTAYSPDARSCGDSADGITSTLFSVETNAFDLVAADPRVLKYGSLLTVPGYADDMVVPVLDCGGKIKGNRLDLLYPTHNQARNWGAKWLSVTVWGYADGLPAPKVDPRHR